ncbi:MAG: plastocyanin [Methanocella sp. PtaU1.Bin125]|nr:MAG: plastocyanin [Methanocella sp. PtaU1.Bin125]
MEMKKLIFLFLTVLVVLAFAVPAQAETHHVSMKNRAFVPQELTVSAGDTVTWTNDDPMLHDVDLGALGESPDLRKGETYSMTFDRPGTYDYVCNIHPGMAGKIVVK